MLMQEGVYLRIRAKSKKSMQHAKKIGANHTYLSLKKLPSPAIMRGFIVGDT